MLKSYNYYLSIKIERYKMFFKQFKSFGQCSNSLDLDKLLEKASKFEKIFNRTITGFNFVTHIYNEFILVVLFDGIDPDPDYECFSYNNEPTTKL